jgi:hypothetical protein
LVVKKSQPFAPLEKVSIRPTLVSLVTEIQGATGWAVDAIRLMGRAIGGVDEKMTAIAAPVEEHCPANDGDLTQFPRGSSRHKGGDGYDRQCRSPQS